MHVATHWLLARDHSLDLELLARDHSLDPEEVARQASRCHSIFNVSN